MKLYTDASTDDVYMYLYMENEECGIVYNYNNRVIN